MQQYHLGFISDELLFRHVQDTVERYRTSIDLRMFNHNVVDPIKLTFDAKVYGKDYHELIESECIRQIDKSNTNHIGYFHQNLFRYIGRGWSVPSEGFDLINEDRHIFVELKNKHNTMNSSSATATYARMQHQILHDDQATCMLVEVIAKRSCDEKWVVGSLAHRNIRRVSIDQFYQIALGSEYPFAFRRLCQVLPTVLDDVIVSLKLGGIQNSVYEELESQYPGDPLKSLFLLAFASYQGFDQF